MAKAQLDPVMRHIRDRVKVPGPSSLTDGELLERFAGQQDEAAFEALVARHAPLVLGICRRTLHDPHDVEDAFQAVFLVLARKANRLDRRASLSNWLFTVTRLVALKMRAQKTRRQADPAKVRSQPPPDPLAEITARELYAALDEELAQLPEKYRAPLLLCYLEGNTQDEAARQLGLSLATMKRRLGQGRECLRRRLVRRGLTLPAALFAVLLGQANTSAAGHAPLLRSTIQAALLFNAHGTAPASVSPQAVALARVVSKAMLSSKLSTLSAVIVGLILTISGAGILACAQVDAGPQAAGLPCTPAPQANPAGAGAKPEARVDRHGDPLPAEAVARLGTVRFRHGLSVDSLTFSPDGERVASWDCFRGLVLWDVASGRADREFPIGIDARAVAFSPDGKTLAIPYCSGKTVVIGLLEVATGREVAQLKAGSTNFATLAFSHNGKLLATSTYDGSLRLWDVATGRPLQELRKALAAGGFAFSQSVAFTPDDRALASACNAEPIVLWDVATGDKLRQFKGHQGSLFFVNFSPGGQTLLAAGEQGARLWEVATGKEAAVLGEQCGNACVSRDGKVLASSHAGGLIRLWDVPTGKPIRAWRTGGEDPRTLAFSPDGKLLGSGGWDSTVHLWDVATGKEVQPRGTHRGTIRALAFEPDGGARQGSKDSACLRTS